jgi:hypothetical protein
VGSLVNLARGALYDLIDGLDAAEPEAWRRVTFAAQDCGAPDNADTQTLIVDAPGFQPEGTDPALCLAAYLGRAHAAGWRRFLLTRVRGQRLISTAVMGRGDTDDVVVDIHGTPGEYLGAFMQGGLVRCHGNAQNFTAMGMHHGRLEVYGNAGKVCGYASKGGEVWILGNVVDRAWTNSVNDPRCQDLAVNIFGTASKYCGESLMGGDFVFAGLAWDGQGRLHLQERPFRGTKLLGGASRGNMLFFDPEDRLLPDQHTQGRLREIDAEAWPAWRSRLEDLLTFGGVPLQHRDGRTSLTVEGRSVELTPATCKLLVPRGGLKGYESH